MELIQKLGRITYPIGYGIQNAIKPDPFLPSPALLTQNEENMSSMDGGTYTKQMYTMVGNHFIVGLLVGLAAVAVGIVSVKPIKKARRVYRRRAPGIKAAVRRVYTRRKS